MNDIAHALKDFLRSGYDINVIIASKDFFPIEIKTEADGQQSLIYKNRVICTIGATKTDGEAKIIVSLGEEKIDLMEQFRSRMKEELL